MGLWTIECTMTAAATWPSVQFFLVVNNTGVRGNVNGVAQNLPEDFA